MNVDWQQIVTDAGVPVLLIDHDGRVVHASASAARLFAKRSARDAIGCRLSELFPAAAAAERAEISRQVAQTGEAVVVRDLWSGVGLRAVVRQAGPPSDRVAMWVYAQETALLEETAEKHGLRVIDARHTDMGPLAGLTMSELKVLSLIGEGLSNADIAARLHRAVKTIESHRASLTEKLGVSSRVQLGIMARRAGLAKRIVINDSRRESVAT